MQPYPPYGGAGPPMYPEGPQYNSSMYPPPNFYGGGPHYYQDGPHQGYHDQHGQFFQENRGGYRGRGGRGNFNHRGGRGNHRRGGGGYHHGRDGPRRGGAPYHRSSPDHSGSGNHEGRNDHDGFNGGEDRGNYSDFPYFKPSFLQDPWKRIMDRINPSAALGPPTQPVEPSSAVYLENEIPNMNDDSLPIGADDGDELIDADESGHRESIESTSKDSSDVIRPKMVLPPPIHQATSQPPPAATMEPSPKRSSLFSALPPPKSS